jgi:hypothetical protein
MNDKFRITKGADGNSVYVHQNEVVSKDVFDQRRAQSADEQKEMRKPDAFDAEFDDMRSKAETLKKPIKKAHGGEVISSASRRGDGIAKRGKTRGKLY